jgi:mRNA-degrading endonuclease RelE of RelBE toxin-antitoxin system
MRWSDELEARLTTAQTTATALLDATLAQILNATEEPPTEEPIAFSAAESVKSEILNLWPKPEGAVAVRVRAHFCQIPQKPSDLALRESAALFWLLGMTKDFRKSIKAIDRKLQGRILGAISEISEDPVTPRGDTVKPLSGDRQKFWRYRIGDFRLVYLPDKENHQITLCTFAPRGGAYD